MTNRTFEDDLAGLFSDKVEAPATLRRRVAAVPDDIGHLAWCRDSHWPRLVSPESRPYLSSCCWLPAQRGCALELDLRELKDKRFRS